MKLAGLQERIAKWEDLHTDFKDRFDSNRELAKDLVCFANTDGGQLFFGISGDKHIVGVDDPDWLFNKVKNPAPKDLALVCPGRGLSMTLLCSTYSITPLN
jgi:hypothetical protein